MHCHGTHPSQDQFFDWGHQFILQKAWKNITKLHQVMWSNRNCVMCAAVPPGSQSLRAELELTSQIQAICLSHGECRDLAVLWTQPPHRMLWHWAALWTACSCLVADERLADLPVLFSELSELVASINCICKLPTRDGGVLKDQWNVDST